MSPLDAIEVVTQLPRLKPRPADSNKGSFGRVLVVAGSRGMSGAAVLCGSAALRGGAGLVYVAVPESIQSIVACGNPCYLTEPLPEDQQGRVAATSEPSVMLRVRQMNAVAFGPGLGQHRGTVQLALSLTSHCPVPLVIGADGINALGEHSDRLHRDRIAAPRILTPHPGEFARLVGCDIPHVQANRRELAVNFAAEHGVVLVLKGFGTIVTDGKRVYVNATGNPGMATGGTGDVLTGLIAALLGQGLTAFDATQLGVYWHGLAGDLARDEVGEVSLIASDLLTYLPKVIQRGG
jgi:ADP-dependent NAD(P)H-hydrate dehydratase